MLRFRLAPPAIVAGLGLLPVLALVLAVGAFAADAAVPAVSVPYGAWIGGALEWGRDLLLGLAGWAVARYAPAALRQYLTDQRLARAIDFAIAAVEGAEKGKTLTLPVANQVLAAAEAYAVANFPRAARWLGDTLRAKLIARLGAAAALPPESSAAKLGAGRAA